MKQGQTRTRDRFFNYLHIPAGKGIHMRQRKGKDIWTGLFELPLLESDVPLTKAPLKAALDRDHGAGWTVSSKGASARHVLSHQIIHAVFWDVLPPRKFILPDDWRVIPFATLAELAVPRLIERWMADELETKP